MNIDEYKASDNELQLRASLKILDTNQEKINGKGSVNYSFSGYFNPYNQVTSYDSQRNYFLNYLKIISGNLNLLKFNNEHISSEKLIGSGDISINNFYKQRWK